MSAYCLGMCNMPAECTASVSLSLYLRLPHRTFSPYPPRKRLPVSIVLKMLTCGTIVLSSEAPYNNVHLPVGNRGMNPFPIGGQGDEVLHLDFSAALA